MKKLLLIFLFAGSLFAQTNQSTIKRTGWINDTTRAVVSDSLAKAVLKTDSTNAFATPTQVKGLIGDTSAVLQAEIDLKESKADHDTLQTDVIANTDTLANNVRPELNSLQSQTNGKVAYDSLSVFVKDSIGYPFSPSASTPSVSTLNLLTSDTYPSGTIRQIKLNASGAGWLYCFAAKPLGSNKFRVIKEFPIYIRASGVNTIETNIQIDSSGWMFGVKKNGIQILTKSSGASTGLTLYYTGETFDASSVWIGIDNHGHNIEVTVRTGNSSSNTKIKNSSIIGFLGDSITDFCDSPSSNGIQYIGYDKFLAEKIKWSYQYIYGYSAYCITNQHAGSTSGGEILTRTSLWSHADFYTIYLGTNDYNFSRSLGTTADYTLQTDTTFYGCYKRLIDTLYSINANAEILLCTPTKRDYNSLDSWTDVNSLGYSFEDYANAIRWIAQYEGLPLIDLDYEAGFNRKTFAQLTYDSLHPNSDGYKRISNIFYKALLPLIK